jgi:anti-sigma-K factor RskA
LKSANVWDAEHDREKAKRRTYTLVAGSPARRFREQQWREGVMQDDELDALAAEYVLGTLASDERAHAEALIAIDPGFVEIVRRWERRLGELNVMVEAVEPPTELWDKIKGGIGKVTPADEVRLAPNEPSLSAASVASPASTATAETKEKAEAETKSEIKAGSEEASILAALASTLLSPEGQADGQATDKSHGKAPADIRMQPGLPRPQLTPSSAPGGADVFYLAHRVRRWRQIGIGCGALAALLALFIVLTQAEPGLIPPGIIQVPQLFSQAALPEAGPGSQFVAVLQQDPSAPAFLLTLDPASRTLTVRTVSAKTPAGHSYELWVIAPHAAKPRSLGVVGAGQYTQRPMPAEFDADTMRAATYAISFEPAGGSKTGQPSGPILFTGKLVQSVPQAPEPTPKT